MVAIAHAAIGITDEILCDALSVVDAYFIRFYTTRRVGSTFSLRSQLTLSVPTPSAKAPSWTIIPIICAISPIPVISTPIISRLRRQQLGLFVDGADGESDSEESKHDKE
jgi:hypothetical protein